MANKFIDFDRFLDEKKQTSLTVKVYGKEYKIKDEVPAIVPILLARAGESANNSTIGDTIMRAGDIMFGKDVITELCNKGMSAEEMGALIRTVFSRVSGQDIDGDDREDEQNVDDASGKVVQEKNGPTK